MMVLTRAVEDRMVAMYKSGDLLGSLYTGHWHEAISVGSAAALSDGDYMAPIHRDLGAHLCRGMEPWQVMASFMGKATSPTGGGTAPCTTVVSIWGSTTCPATYRPTFPWRPEWRSRPSTAARIGCAWHSAATARPLAADFHEALNMAGALTLAVHLRHREQSVRLLHPGQHADCLARLCGEGRGVRFSRRQGGRHGRTRGLRRGERSRQRGPGRARAPR